MCKWIISVNESSQIQITWLTFSLENQHSCNNDYVEIYDDSNSGNSSKIARLLYYLLLLIILFDRIITSIN